MVNTHILELLFLMFLQIFLLDVQLTLTLGTGIRGNGNYNNNNDNHAHNNSTLNATMHAGQRGTSKYFECLLSNVLFRSTDL